MKRPYYIQRATFQDQPHREGIDSILNFDYMGSSEFEFGALNHSLKRIRAALPEYRLAHVPVYHEGSQKFDQMGTEVVTNAMGKKLLLLAKTTDHPFMPEIINLLKNDKIGLKEWSGFKDWFRPEANIPTLAFIKRKMKRINTRHGYRHYSNESGSLRYSYHVESGKIELEGASGLKFNLWWDIANDWMMFFGTPEQARKLMEKVGFVLSETSQMAGKV